LLVFVNTSATLANGTSVTVEQENLIGSFFIIPGRIHYQDQTLSFNKPGFYTVHNVISVIFTQRKTRRTGYYLIAVNRLNGRYSNEIGFMYPYKKMSRKLLFNT
jgi:hypothetical protein